MGCSTSGFPVHHQLLNLAQTHVYRVGDASQPSHHLSSPAPSAFNLSQHQSLFQLQLQIQSTLPSFYINSIQFTLSVLSNSLWPHGLQHTRLPCPLPISRACSNSCPSSQWFHPIISSSVIPFSFCLQSFPASGTFQVSQLFASCGQSIGVSASTLVLPMSTQDWSPLGWTGWISILKMNLSVFCLCNIQYLKIKLFHLVLFKKLSNSSIK